MTETSEDQDTIDWCSTCINSRNSGAGNEDSLKCSFCMAGWDESSDTQPPEYQETVGDEHSISYIPIVPETDTTATYILDRVRGSIAVNNPGVGARGMSEIVSLYKSLSGRPMSDIDGWKFRVAESVHRLGADGSSLEDYLKLIENAVLLTEATYGD